MENERTYSAFAGNRLVANGVVETIIRRVKEMTGGSQSETVLVFDDQTGKQIDFDMRGTADEAVARLASHPLFGGGSPTRSGPGRPKLGVISREVSLLPRHWEWLESQPNGISAAVRRLVDEARKREPGKEKARLAREAAIRFMTAMAGNLPDFEEAARALFAKDRAGFEQLVAEWPLDIRTFVVRLAGDAERFESETA